MWILEMLTADVWGQIGIPNQNVSCPKCSDTLNGYSYYDFLKNSLLAFFYISIPSAIIQILCWYTNNLSPKIIFFNCIVIPLIVITSSVFAYSCVQCETTSNFNMAIIIIITYFISYLIFGILFNILLHKLLKKHPRKLKINKK